MGYSYEGRKLICDFCGTAGARKRKCPYRVVMDGRPLPYCYPAAACDACYKARGKKFFHPASQCGAGAAAAQAREDHRQERLAAGDHEIRTAYGDWHDAVPDGWVGVVFASRAAGLRYVLMAATEYDHRTRRYLSDYIEAGVPLIDWSDPDTATTKRIG